jgi:hypothetical protein
MVNMDDRAYRYLLNTLEDSERDSYEEEWFSSEERLAELESAEAALIGEYLRGALPPVTASRFERCYRSSAGRWRKVAALRGSVAEPGPSRQAPGGFWGLFRVWPRLVTAGLSAALVVTLCGAGWLAALNSRTDRKLADARRELTITQATVSAFTKATGPATILQIRLSPGMNRGDMSGRTAVPASAGLLRVLLQTTEAAGSGPFVATVSTPEGEEVFRASGLRLQAGAREVILPLPTEALRSSDYLVVLRESSGNRDVVATYTMALMRP